MQRRACTLACFFMKDGGLGGNLFYAQLGASGGFIGCAFPQVHWFVSSRVRRVSLSAFSNFSSNSHSLCFHRFPIEESICTNGFQGVESSSDGVCCHWTCGQCGGSGCNDFAEDQVCCKSAVVALNVMCDDVDEPPCLVNPGESCSLLAGAGQACHAHAV